MEGCNFFTEKKEQRSPEKGGPCVHLEGLLGTRECNFDLMMLDNNVFGTFYFSDYEELEDVFGELIEKDSMVLTQSLTPEYDPRLGDEKFNTFLGTFRNGVFEGQFRHKDSILPLRCSLVTSNNIPLRFEQFLDTIKDNASGKPLVYQELESPLPQNPKDEFLAAYLSNLIGGASYHGDFQKYAQAVFASDKQWVDTSILKQIMAHPYHIARYCDVSYNKNGLIVFSYTGLKFLGGMHENYEVKYCSIDLKTKCELRLHDVLNESETKKLSSLLEQKFRRKYNLTPQDKLSKVLFYDENKFVNNNYYITSKGIGFQYDPHELSGFAKGNITLYIPFSELRP